MGLILVASEDLVEIETVRAALSVHGWWVTVAADRQVALRVAADQAPKLVIVDDELSGSIDLLRSFGSDNGGPGVVALVPAGFDRALELKEAGVDEILTKPATPPTVLQAVQRCVASRRSAPPVPSTPSKTLLTTEEIFGEVLRELEEAARPAARPVEPPVPSDDPPATAASGPPPAPAARGDDWQGEERRGSGRPWSPPGSAAAASVPALAVETPAPREEALTPVEPSIPVATSAPAPPEADPVEPPAAREQATAALVSPVSDPSFEPEPWRPEPIEGPGPDAAPAPRAWRPVPTLVSLAAALLIASGAAFFFDFGAAPPEPAGSSIREADPASSGAGEAVPVAASDPAAAAQSPGAEGLALPVVQEAPEPAEERVELDVEAIVEEELGRREEELRRVFVEEERRLLRELENLDPAGPPPAAPAESGGEEQGGAVR